MQRNKGKRKILSQPSGARLVGFWARARSVSRAAEGPLAARRAELLQVREDAHMLHAKIAAAIAERDGLRRELEWTLAHPKRNRWHRAFASLFRGIVRTKHRFALVALQQLVPRLDQPFSWEAIGPDPQFCMLPIQSDFPSGWVVLSSRMQHPGKGNSETKLYLDLGQGFTENQAIRVPVSMRGRILELIRLPPGIHGMRWDPVDAPGRLHQEPLVMIEIGFFERLWRTYRRVSSVLVSQPRPRLDEVGLTWQKALLDPLRAYEAAGILRGKGVLQASAYADWIARFDTLGEQDLARIRRDIRLISNPPRISVVMPTYNTPVRHLRSAIDSVRGQLYPHWELCIADDASTQPQVREVLREYAALDTRIKVLFRTQNGHISAASNSALELATGDYVALFDHDDVLAPNALYHVAKAIKDHPAAQILYSDEDKIDADGNRFDPHFKPDWNPDLLRSQNYISHLGVYLTTLVREVGGLRVGYEGSQDYDLLLRCVARCDDDSIVHIPRVLYHWRTLPGSTAQGADQKTYTQQAGIKALQDYFQTLGMKAEVAPGLVPNTYRVLYPIPDPAPLVSLLIPTRDKLELVRTCVDSVLKKTSYANYEILILDNQSEESGTLAWFDDIQRDRRVRVLRYDHPFNFSAINNFGVSKAKGKIIGLVNNDIEVISEGWLTEMVSHACRPEIGCVGAKLYYDNRTIQHAGIILGVGGVAGHSHKYFPDHVPGYFSRLLLVQNLSAVTAACLLVRKQIYEAVGGLNEADLKVAFNDVDFCLKVREAGYRNLWTPYAELYHHESISRGTEDTPEKQARFAAEVEFMKRTWPSQLQSDPAYSINLTKVREDFSLA